MQTINNIKQRESGVARTSTVGMNATRTTRNRGFTLVELMVVIVVIALLVALLGASLAFMGQQAKEAATNAVIQKIHTQLDQRLESFDRQFGLIETSARIDPDYERAKAYVYSNYRGISTDQLRILVRKQLSRSNFPQSFADIGLTAPAGHTAVTESAEMLYYMLTEMKVGESPPVDAGEFLASEVADTDNDGLLEFVDGWGNPLRFYRWPTRLIRPTYDHDVPTAHDLDHVNPRLLIQGLPGHDSEQMLKSDPDDPLALIVPVPGPDASANEIARAAAASRQFENAFHTPNTYFAPLIVSAGADGELGLYEPNDTANLGHLARPNAANLTTLTDNITNRNQRAGD